MKTGKRTFWKGLILGSVMLLMAGSPVWAEETSSTDTTTQEETGESVKIYKNEIVTINGKQYYYNKKGKLVTGKYGYKIGKNYYKISKKGVLTKISKAQGLAGIRLNGYYGKSRIKTLYKAFRAAANLKYFTNSKKIPSGQTKVEYYGIYGLTKNRGDCSVQAAMFYWYAKALGYSPKFVQGYVPQALDKNGNPTNFGSHTWVTIKIGKTTYVFDPNLGSTLKKNGKSLKTAFKFTYGTKGTYRYFNKKKKEIKK